MQLTPGFLGIPAGAAVAAELRIAATDALSGAEVGALSGTMVGVLLDTTMLGVLLGATTVGALLDIAVPVKFALPEQPANTMTSVPIPTAPITRLLMPTVLS